MITKQLTLPKYEPNDTVKTTIEFDFDSSENWANINVDGEEISLSFDNALALAGIIVEFCSKK